MKSCADSDLICPECGSDEIYYGQFSEFVDGKWIGEYYCDDCGYSGGETDEAFKGNVPGETKEEDEE